MSQEQARPVPIHINTSDVLGEVVIIFVIVFALGNVVRVVIGGQDEGSIVGWMESPVAGLA
jgi:hypothetical protein